MDTIKDQAEWEEYEELIYKIYKELEPHANVKVNDFILGFETGIKRQIDISVKSNIAGHEILIIIQAKKLKKRADATVLGEFYSVIDDVRASKGILICNSGFSSTAKNYAKRKKIDICTAHDASNKRWQTEIQIPVLRKTIKVKVKIQHSYVVVGDIKLDGIHLPFPEVALREFIKKWESDELSKEPGTHFLHLDRESIKFYEQLVPVKNGIEYTIEHRHHFKFLVPSDYRGFKDYITGNFTPSFIEFKDPIPFFEDKTWQYINNPEELAIKVSHLNIEIIDIDMLTKKMLRVNWEKN